jgi:hypothetical protein
LAEAVIRVSFDEPVRQDLIARGVARAKHFTWERTARRFCQVFERVLGQRIAMGAPADLVEPAIAGLDL